MRAIGILLLAVGAFFIMGAAGMDTSVPVGDGSKRVHNIGLMRDQQNGFMLGIGLVIGGIVLIAVGSRTAANPAGTVKCPFCAEQIQPDAKICRFCNRDLPEVSQPAERVPQSEGPAPGRLRKR